MTPVAKLVLVLPGRASAWVLREPDGAYYYDYVWVPKGYRRRGYCTEMLRFVTNYLVQPPEVDVQRASPVAQRIVHRARYQNRGISERYWYCDRWVPTLQTPRRPPCRLETLRVSTYDSGLGRTEVVYLRDETTS